MQINSLKKDVICSYLAMPLTKELSDKALCVVTAAGIIIGSPIPSEKSKDINTMIGFIGNNNAEIFTKYKENKGISNKAKLPGNDGFFTLKDVKLVSGTTTSDFDFIDIFFDQVIAVTLTQK
ncbi:MAG TPA: hypothetical protein DCM59_09495 [Clostridium sp.]|nr:hypothetical protein [Clostridium sp.]